MTKHNQDIRDTIRQAGLYQYEVAEQLDISENYFNSLLHKRLTDQQKKSIVDAINSALAQKEA